jgi:hypothetical protein
MPINKVRFFMLYLKKQISQWVCILFLFMACLASSTLGVQIPDSSGCDEYFINLSRDLDGNSQTTKKYAEWLFLQFRGVSHIFIGKFIEKAGREPRIADMGGGSAPSQLVKYRVLETLFVKKPMDPKNLKLKVGSEIITSEPMRNLVELRDSDGSLVGIKLPEKIFHPKARIIVMMSSMRNSQRSIRLPNGKVVKLPEFSNHTVSVIGKGMNDTPKNRDHVKFLLSCRKDVWSKRWGHP